MGHSDTVDGAGGINFPFPVTILVHIWPQRGWL